MKFFDSFTKNASTIGGALQGGAAIGSALAGLSDGGVTKETNKTIDAVSKVNARRIAREMEYLQGQARAQMAQQGGNHGTNVFLAASNARRAEENRQQVLINAERQKAGLAASQPSRVERGLGATMQILGVGVDAAGRRLQRDQFTRRF